MNRTLNSSPETEAPGATRLDELLGRMLDDRLDTFPELATRLGCDTGDAASRRRRLDARSAQAIDAYLARHGQQLDALAAIDATGLSPMQRIDRDAVLFHGRALEAAARCLSLGSPTDVQPYVVTQLSGAYQTLPDFLCTKHPLQSADDARAYLERLQGFGTALHDERRRVEAAAAQGIVPPSFVLDTTLRQLATLAEGDAGASPLVHGLADRARQQALSDHAAWAAKASRLVSEAVQPAARSLMEVLARWRAVATDDAGVWHLPQGEAYYQHCIAYQTTTTMSAAEIHRIGLDQVAELTARIDEVLQTEGWREGSVAERLAALARDERHVYPNDDAGKARLLQELRERVADMQARLPDWFDPLPRAGLEVRGVPPAIESGAPRGYYTPGPADGSRPGAFYANLRDTRDWKRWYAPSFAYHEGVPGHHLQIALALQTEGISMLRRTLWFAAHGEGWALYAEQLADEMGVYDRYPMGRVGYLQSMLFRAARLVVDTGLHAERWTREQAVDYLVRTVGETRNRSLAEVDRYCVMPAQALSYKIGHLCWQRLRDAVRLRDGERFDLKRFHADALRWGGMPLAQLEAVMRA